MATEPSTILVTYDVGQHIPNVGELKTDLEKGDVDVKIRALKTAISLMLSGEKMPQLLMTIIRFVVPVKSHLLKKLLLCYFEVISKKGADGKLLPEMILVCNALRSDLIHPNEYVRGSTLRYVCKLKEPELLEPLVPSVKQNLDHRHSYVRRNAILCLHAIHKDYDFLCPDAPSLVFQALLNEGDASCKRNAFVMLCASDQDKAIEYLQSVSDQVMTCADILQFAFIEFIRKVGRTSPSLRSKFLRTVVTLLQADSPAVRYEAAGCLLSLSSTPVAIKTASQTYIDLLCNQSDNNVKLIVLDKLVDIKRQHSKVLQDLLMDILRALATPTMDIRQKTIDLAMDLVNPRNIDEVVMLLKKEINKTQAEGVDKASEYRQMLIQAIHNCAVKFPDVASAVVHTLMDFLGDNSASAVDVIVFVREVVETYPDLRQGIVGKLLQSMDQIKSAKVYRGALWIIGEYSVSLQDIEKAFTTVKKFLGPMPFLKLEDKEEDEKEKEKRDKENAEKEKEKIAKTKQSKVLADGTYATQSAYTETARVKTATGDDMSQLRSLIIAGDFFLASVVASTLTKICLRLRELNVKPIIINTVTAESMFFMTSALMLGKHPNLTSNPIDADSGDRIITCLNILSQPGSGPAASVVLNESRKAFHEMLQEQKSAREEDKAGKQSLLSEADDALSFRQLRPSRIIGGGDMDDQYEFDLDKATGLSDVDENKLDLNRVHQLTGFSDPLYSEAYVNVHRYDIMLDVLVINRTQDTLQNVSLELATHGDLKLCERPQNYSIAPKAVIRIKANIKVSSTETGIIFGNLVYDIAGHAASDKNCVVLNDIHIDIMDYIAPAVCNDMTYRIMWAEFEWENKVVINSSIGDLNDFLDHITSTTNMRCLTPPSALQGNCGFLAANLYAKSIFGEDALANVSVGLQPDGMITGYIRIRSKTQGIALSLGDKITLNQAKKNHSPAH